MNSNIYFNDNTDILDTLLAIFKAHKPLKGYKFNCYF